MIMPTERSNSWGSKEHRVLCPHYGSTTPSDTHDIYWELGRVEENTAFDVLHEPKETMDGKRSQMRLIEEMS